MGSQSVWVWALEFVMAEEYESAYLLAPACGSGSGLRFASESASGLVSVF
jgi:hypothetical protein